MVLLLGQSNANGYAQTAQLANALNPGYVLNPAKVHIYYKDGRANPDLTADNGQWQDYRAGTNSDTNASPKDQFGPELALANRLVVATGNEVYVIKGTLNGTGLAPNAPTISPGTWTDATAGITMNYFYKRALRDLKTARPGVTIRFRGVLWWQGEADAAGGIPGADYAHYFKSMRGYVDSIVGADFTGYPWALIGVNYSATPEEAAVNAELCGIAAADAKAFYFPSLGQLRNIELSPAQSAPLPVDPSDKHIGWMGQLVVGEEAAAIFLGNGSDRGC
nr:sialate O-acetylesterase [Sphingomonas sp. R-74633]